MTTQDQRHANRPNVLYIMACIIVLFLCPPYVVAEQAVDGSVKATPWTHQNFPNAAQTFQFAIVSDNAANPRPGVFQAALTKLQLLRPDFVLSVGDFIHGYGANGKPLEEEDAIRAKRREFDGALKKLTIPFYRIPGNHDINSDLSARIWKEMYGPAYYSFVYKNVLFLCLNSQDGEKYGPGIGPKQISWIEDVLTKHDDLRWICLFFHQPLWLEDEKRLKTAKERSETARLTGFRQVEELLEGRDYTVFAGHHHRYGKWIRNGNKFFRLATTGGQSVLRGPEAGQFDHVMWVTMTKQNPVVCNLLLEGILDEDAKRNMSEPLTQVE